MLNSLFGDKNFKKPQHNITTNKNILRTINNNIFNIIYLIYKIITVFIYPFQRNFITFYTVELQLDRLPFRTLPNSIKYILIYFVDIEAWILFFKRIKNNTNLYIIREKNHTYLHRLWCVFFRNNSFYYYELNIKNLYNNKISNFFYKTRIRNKETKKISNKKYKVMLFFFVNKLVFHSYPYFYWTYFYAYNKHQYDTYGTSKSQHVRAHIFFFLLHKFITLNPLNKTFVKLDFYSFKGIKKSIKHITTNQLKNFVYILKKKQRKDKILTKIEDQVRLFDKNFIKKYFDLNKNNVIKYKFYLSYIIEINTLKFNDIIANYFLNVSKKFKLRWYTKVQNSIHNFQKNNIFFFLRTAKHFNKGRYSRNRQLYRTGVYWCIWLNVVIVYSLHFYFYRVVYSFGYLWIPLGILILSIFSSRLYKYRYYNIKHVLIEFKEFNNFLFYFFLKLKHVYNNMFKSKINYLLNYLHNYAVVLFKLILSKIISIFSFFKKNI